MKRNDTKIIDGELFRELVISGANNLFNHYPEIDSLNVFPVPDGDTGTNMNLTIGGGAKEVANIRNENISEVCKIFSRGLLMGARGNSGVILSQIFRGISKGLGDQTSIDAVGLSEALSKGAEVAYHAVMKPVEGTILTVIRESSEALKEQANKNMTIADAIELTLNAAKKSLDHTPELLPVLKEVGVVDSGGAGLVRIFEGMYLALTKGVVARGTTTKDNPNPETDINISKKEDVKYIYTLDLVLKVLSAIGKKNFDNEKFTNTLKGLGENVEIQHRDNYIKVSLNTIRPGQVLNACQNFGEFVTLDIKSNKHEDISKNFFEKKQPLKPFGIIATSVGKGLDELFKGLGVNYIVSGGQTMNPSTEDFCNAIKEIHCKNVIILPNNKNIIMAAEQSKYCTEGVKVEVVPTKTIMQGLVSAMMANPEETLKKNVTEMENAMNSVKSGSVTFSIKDTKIDDVEIKKDYFMGIGDGKILCCVQDKNECVKELINKLVDDESSLVTIIYGEGVSEEEANDVSKYAESLGYEVELHKGDQPVYSYFVGVE